MKIAVTSPGKLGDCLYCLPAVRYLCKKHNKKADFWTTKYCKPLKNLFEYQSCISKFIINHDYVKENENFGIQPWLVPVAGKYEAVYHLGFRNHPNQYIPDYICQCLNIPYQPITYEYPKFKTLKEYIVVATRKEEFWRRLIVDLSKSIDVVEVGGKGDYLGVGIDKTGLDFLETTTWIAKSKVFMGCMSSQLVLAEGFPIPKYAKLAWQDVIIKCS